MQNRLQEALQMKGLKQVDIVNMTGIPKASISAYITQRYQPTSTPLYQIAKALNVSEMWLAGYDTPMERRVEMINMADADRLATLVKQTTKYYNLLSKAERLNDEQLDMIINLIDNMRRD